jgi:hypothetical protein
MQFSIPCTAGGALFIRKSTLPKSFMTLSANLSKTALSAISPTNYGFSFISITATFAPALKKASAVALQIPFVPPVMTAILSLNIIACHFFNR